LDFQEIRIMDAQEGDPDNNSSELLVTDVRVADPRWSPDGSKLVFEVGVTPDSNVYWVPTDGSGLPVQLTFEYGKESGPDWSPDGSMIAYG
jgi:Tol biopolymer transport system component